MRKAVLLSFALMTTSLLAQSSAGPVKTSAEQTRIPDGAKLYIADMNGFEGEMRMALASRAVDVEYVDTAAEADYIVTGWVKLVARHRGAVHIDTTPPADAAMMVTTAVGDHEVFHRQIHIRFAGEGSRDAAKALAKKFAEYLNKTN